MKNTDTPAVQYEQDSFLPFLDKLSTEDLASIRRGKILDGNEVLLAEYNRRLNQAISVALLGVMATVIWFFLTLDGKLEISAWEFARTFIPMIGGIIIALAMIYSPGKRLAEAPLPPVFGPGKL